MANNIKEALQKLDAGNANHWTSDGSPRLETVKFNNGGVAVSREELETAFPGFNKSTAAGYWLSYSEPVQEVVGAETAASEQGSETPVVSAVGAPQPAQSNESPSGNGEGAAPEAKALEPDSGSNSSTVESEAEQLEVEAGEQLESDEIETMEKAIQATQEHIAELRTDIDNIQNGINELLQTEEEYTAKLEQLRRDRGDYNPANHIQRYLASQKEIAANRAAQRQKLVDSGVDLKSLNKIVGRSPIDQAMRRQTGRGRPTRI